MRWLRRRRLLREAEALEREAAHLRRYALTFRMTDHCSPTGAISALAMERAVRAEQQINAERQERAARLGARATALREEAARC